MNKRGGKRPGAGRPKKENSKSHVINFRVDQDTYEKLEKLLPNGAGTVNQVARSFIQDVADMSNNIGAAKYEQKP